MTERPRSGSARRGGGGRRAEPGGRGLTQHLRRDAKRSHSSTLWLTRQLNDPYVAEAKKRGYRSRAAFKLMQLDDKFHFLKPGAKVVDLGAAPGGWLQVAAERVLKEGRGRILGLDLLPIEPLPGIDLLQLDFMAEAAPDRLRALLDGPADIVMTDMAASATGHGPTDHLKIMALAEAAYDFAKDVLKPGGTFLAKVLQGGASGELLAALKRDFASVRHVKPPASRKESAEIYVLAMGFRGGSR